MLVFVLCCDVSVVSVVSFVSVVSERCAVLCLFCVCFCLFVDTSSDRINTSL